MNRFRMIPMLAAAGCAMVAVAPAVAIAGAETSLTNTVPGWYYRMPQNATNIDMLMTVDALDENVLYTGGIYMDGSSLDTVFNMHGVAYWSQDAGARVNDIAGVLKGTMADMCVMVDIDAVSPGIGSNARTVWASCGTSLGLAPQGSSFTKKFDAPKVGDDPDTLNCIHMFDASHGIAGAESGAIYLFQLSEDGNSVTFTPADVSNQPSTEHPSASPGVVAMNWLSRSTGWAVATDGEITTETDGEGTENELQWYYGTRVYKTTDGGKTWELAGNIDMASEDPVHTTELFGKTNPLTFTGGWLPREIRMVDGNTGFMGMVAWENTKSLSVVAKLMKTTDGGRTWTDLAVNMQVGTMTVMIKTGIYLSEIAGMYFWKDADGLIKGRVVGSAFVAEGSSSGGTPPKYFYLATLDLGYDADGAQTWTKYPDLGDQQMDMTGGGTPINTPRAFDAKFVNQYRGFAVGDKGTVFRFQYKCTKQSQCDFGYYCNTDELTCLSCADIGLTNHEGSIEKCSGWAAPVEDEELAGRDAFENPDDDTLVLVDATQGRDLAGYDGGNADGCAAGTSPSSPLPILLIALSVASMLMVSKVRRGRGSGF